MTKTEVDGWGYNCRLDNLQAAIWTGGSPSSRPGSSTAASWPAIYDEMLTGHRRSWTARRPGRGPTRRDVFQNYTIMTDGATTWWLT